MNKKKDLEAKGDLIQPFLIDHSHIRGQLVRLESVAHTIIEQHRYPKPASKLLAEMLVLAAMLSSNLKSDGILTIQAKGDGPIRFIVVDATSGGDLRGYAEMAKGGKTTLSRMGKTRVAEGKLADFLGKGYLAITLDHGDENSRYQGIVELAGTTLADALSDYFTQSQQVEMSVKLAVSPPDGASGTWRAAGIMMERVPTEGGTIGEEQEKQEKRRKKSKSGEETSEEQWQRNNLFLKSVKNAELLSGELSSWDLLTRLFNEDGVWAYPPKILQARCRCSREKIERVLGTIPESELEEMFVGKKISVHCQFCNTTESFTRPQIETLYRA